MMQMVIDPQGCIRCLYSEEIDLSLLGQPTITRVSQIEPDSRGRWWVDLELASGPILGPFHLRSEALAAEQQWLEQHYLTQPSQPTQQKEEP